MNRFNYLLLVLGLCLGMLTTTVSAKTLMMNGNREVAASLSGINEMLPDAMATPSAMPDNQSVECVIAGGFLRIGPGNGAIAFCSGVAADTIYTQFFSFPQDTIASYLWSTGATTTSIMPTTTNTYFVTITDIHGCTMTASKSVTVNPSPAPPVIDSLPGTLCNEKLFDHTTATTYRWSTLATTDTITVTNGTYTLTITDAAGCTASATHTVVIPGAPTATITGNGPFTFCAGGSVILTAHGGGTYHWDNNSTVATRTITTAGTYTVTVTLNGCTDITSQVVTISNPPTVTITPNGTVNVCAGSSVNLSTNFQQGGSTYLWSTGATTRPITVTPTATTTYTVTVTNAAGCTGTATKQVVFNALPVPVIDSSALVGGCYRTLSTHIAYTTYLWSTGETTATIHGTTGTYTVTVTNAAGCTGTATHTTVITGQPAPVITFTGNDSICAGTTKVLSLSTTFQSYHWSTNVNTATITVNATGNYSVTVTRTGGCTAVAHQTITVITVAPTIQRIGFGPLCSGNVNQLRVPVVTGYSAYHWSTNATTDTITFNTTATYRVTVTNYLGCTGTASINETVNASPTAPVITVTTPTNCTKLLTTTTNYSTYAWTGGGNTNTKVAATSGTYVVTVSNASGCTATNSSTVTVTPGPTPTVVGNGPLTFCLGDSVRLSTVNSYNAYIWSTNATTATITVLVSGNYRVTVTDAQGCTGVANLQVTVNGNTAPNVTPANPINICGGGTVTLTLTNPNAFASHVWSNGSTANTITVNTSGTYSVSTTTTTGCTNVATRTVTVYPLPTPTVTANGPTTFCTGGSVILSTQSYSIYRWSQGNASTQSITVTTSGTYIVTVTTPQGCTATAQQVVVVNPNIVPTITANGPTTFCAGGSVVLSTQNYTTYAWSPGGQTTQSITVTTSGAYILAVSNGNGCTGTATRTVTVNPAPTAVITPNGPTSFCTGGSVVLSASTNASYHWSNNATTQAITVTTAGTYIVTVTNAFGCTSTASQVVTVGGNLTVTITPSGSTSLCSGGSVSLNAGTYNSYLWSNGATTQTINVNSAGTYTVTATQSVGCTGTASITVTVNANPSPSIVANGPTTFCSGGSVILDAGSFSSYSWSNASTTQTISATNTGNYVVTVTDINGCTASASQSITVNASPTPSIIHIGPVNFCSGGSVTLIAGNYTSYLWSTGGTDISIVATTSGTYVVTVSDAIGCSGTASQVVSVTAALNPAITANSPTSFCNGGSVTLLLPGYATYIWSNGATIDSIIVTTSGTYNVTVTSGGGCSGSTSQVVNVFNIPSPVLTTSGPTTFCTGGSVTIDAGSYASYIWSTSETTQTINVTTSGNYGVTITDNNGCNATALQTVTVNTNPSTTVTASGNTTFCDGGSVTLDAGSFASYSWSNAATTQTISATTSGTYAVTVTNANGCTGTASQVVTVNAVPTPVINANGPTSFCPGGSVGLDAGFYPIYSWSNAATTQTITANTNGIFTVSVTDGNGCVGTASQVVTVFAAATPVITSSGPLTFCSGDSISLDAGLFATYNWSTSATDGSIYVSTSGTFTVTVDDVNGCTGTASATTTVNAAANPTITANGPTTFCSGGSVVLSAGNFTTYDWSTGATTQSITASTTNTYSVTVTNVGGCIGVATQDVIENTSPVVTIFSSGSDTVCTGFSVNLNAGNYVSYSWSNSATTQSINASTAATYVVTVTDANGCTGTASQLVAVNPLPTVTFTFATTTVCVNWPAITVTGGSPNGGSYIGAGVTGNQFTPSIAGVGSDTITYSYTDPTTLCTNTAIHVIDVLACTDVPTLSSGYFVAVYPNPNDGNFTISYNVASQINAIRIIDMAGRVVYTQAITGLEGKDNINASNLSKGIYYWEAVSNEGISSKGKIVIVK